MGHPRDQFIDLLRSEDNVSTVRGQLPVFSVAVSPDEGKVAATTGEKLMLFELATGARQASISATNFFGIDGAECTSVTFSPDGKRLVVGSGNGLVVFLDAFTLQRVKEPLSLHGSQVWDLSYGLNGTILASGGGFGTMVKLTESASGRPVREVRGLDGSFPPQPLAVSRDGRVLATGSPEQLVRLWDIASGRLMASSTQKARFLHCVEFSHDSNLLAYADELGAIFLWDASGQRPVRKLVGHAGPVLSLAFSPDGRTLASAGMDHTIRLWQPEIDQEVAILSGHTGWVWCVAFAENGNTLLSGSRDGTLKAWRALSLKEIEASENAEAARR